MHAHTHPRTYARMHAQQVILQADSEQMEHQQRVLQRTSLERRQKIWRDKQTSDVESIQQHLNL